MTGSWRVMPDCQICEKGHLTRYPWNSLFSIKINCFTQFFTHNINTLITPELKGVLFRDKNPSKNTWELGIVIPTIIYTFSLGFPLLLHLNIYILERFLAQILTTPNQSVESNFGAIGKYWNEPLSGECNRFELRDSRQNSSRWVQVHGVN